MGGFTPSGEGAEPEAEFDRGVSCPSLPPSPHRTPRQDTPAPLGPAACRGRPEERRGGGSEGAAPASCPGRGASYRRSPRGRGSPRTWSDMAGRGAGDGLGWAAAGLGSFLCPQRKHRPRRGRDFLCA